MIWVFWHSSEEGMAMSWIEIDIFSTKTDACVQEPSTSHLLFYSDDVTMKGIDVSKSILWNARRNITFYTWAYTLSDYI